MSTDPPVPWRFPACCSGGCTLVLLSCDTRLCSDFKHVSVGVGQRAQRNPNAAAAHSWWLYLAKAVKLMMWRRKNDVCGMWKLLYGLIPGTESVHHNTAWVKLLIDGFHGRKQVAQFSHSEKVGQWNLLIYIFISLSVILLIHTAYMTATLAVIFFLHSCSIAGACSGQLAV